MSPGKETSGKPVEDVAFGLSLDERPDVHVRCPLMGKPWDNALTPESSLVPTSSHSEDSQIPLQAHVPRDQVR